MKVMAFNGSPREKWNTATLLEKALDGAASHGAETRLVHLYDLDHKEKRRREIFPMDCENACDLCIEMAGRQ